MIAVRCKCGQGSRIRWARLTTAFGTNFSLFSEVAERVELCLFDEHTGREHRLDMPEADGYVWHCFVPLIGPANCPTSGGSGRTVRR